jgi:hypothetical protein
MRRLLRILLNTITSLSLLLSMAVVVLWARSYKVSNLLICRTNAGSYSLIAERGEVCVRWLATTQHTPLERAQWSGYQQPADPGARYVPPQSTERRLGGFWIERGTMPIHETGRPAIAYVAVVVPFWPLVLFLAVASALVARNWLRRHNHRGRCAVCNYDLRATPNRCPECGTETTPTATPPIRCPTPNSPTNLPI